MHGEVAIQMLIEEVQTRHLLAAGWTEWPSALKAANVKAARVLGFDPQRTWIVFSDNDFSAIYGQDPNFKRLVDYLRGEGIDLLGMAIRSWFPNPDESSDFCRQIRSDFEGRELQRR